MTSTNYRTNVPTPVQHLSSSVHRTVKLADAGAITSLCLNAAGDHFFVGTSKSNIYLVHLESFAFELRSTSHAGKINDVQFPGILI